jgi:hypothetical protein
MCFFVDLIDQECFGVTSDDILTPDEIWEFWPLVEEADKVEIKSFVVHKWFRLQPRNKFGTENRLDGIWVPRWKDRKKRLIKSRMCGRGYLDKQKHYIDRHSSTASRLSHRLAISQGILHNLKFETIDVTTAFLQGLKFSEIASRAAELGHETKATRNVYFIPPMNVWRHLRENKESQIKVSDDDALFFLLELLKAICGVVDGPLLFQLAFLHFLCTQLQMTRSIHDDNYLYATMDSTGDFCCTCG